MSFQTSQKIIPMPSGIVARGNEHVSHTELLWQHAQESEPELHPLNTSSSDPSPSVESVRQ